MRKNSYVWAIVVLLALGGAACSKAPAVDAPGSIIPAKMPRVGAVDERFQSFNVEMVEVIGGRFWKPYKDTDAAPKAQPPAKQPASGQPAGLDPSKFQQRPPIDLTNPRLRKLAAALGPAYVRVSGTWANTTYFQNSEDAAAKKPPTGFSGVLTREQWKGVVDFSHAVDAKIVTSFAISPGTRDRAGVWTPNQARELLDYTKSIGGSVAAAEFMNEPNVAEIGGAPKGYDAAAYGRDLAVFQRFIKGVSPDMLIVGPGSVGEGLQMGSMKMLTSENLLAAAGPVFDGLSYHFYGAVSERCAGMGAAGATADAALSEEWLSRTDKVESFYAALRDRFVPGKPLWITETAQAACGGDRWASTFLDSFRYLDQLGRLAKRGVQVIVHNTLASSDYGLLDEGTLNPRPNYWAALLWRKFMGTTVLDPGPSPVPGAHLYAQCLRGVPGGVALLAINTDRTAPLSLEMAMAADRYTLAASNLSDAHVQMNGVELELGPGDEVPKPAGLPTAPGHLVLPPASITFLAIPTAMNGACR